MFQVLIHTHGILYFNQNSNQSPINIITKIIKLRYQLQRKKQRYMLKTNLYILTCDLYLPWIQFSVVVALFLSPPPQTVVSVIIDAIELGYRLTVILTMHFFMEAKNP